MHGLSGEPPTDGASDATSRSRLTSGLSDVNWVPDIVAAPLLGQRLLDNIRQPIPPFRICPVRQRDERVDRTPGKETEGVSFARFPLGCEM